MTKNQMSDKITEQRKKALDLMLELRTIHDNLGSVRHKNIVKYLYEESLTELDELLKERDKNNNNNNTKN